MIEKIPTLAPAGVADGLSKLGGAGSNGLALSPDGRTLLVTNGGENDVAVIRLSARAADQAAPRAGKTGDDDDDAPKADRSAVVGLIPTGWYPTAVAVRPDGRRIFVVNGKSNTGPDPKTCRVNTGIDPHHDDACRAANTYVWQLEKAGFLTLAPPSPAELGRLTRQVAANNRYPSAAHSGEADAMFAALRKRIHHVIYIVKENRTYDQMLGDLEVGNGDPKLAVFPRAMTPNQHALARNFVDLDAFYDSGESSNTGWNWSTAARTNDWTEREAPVNYAGRGLQYDQEGDNRNVNVGYATSAERVAANPVSPVDPNIVSGARDVAAPDGPGGEEGRGYLWDSAMRAHLSVRNYGFYGDLTRYEKQVGEAMIPREREPAKTGLKVFYVAKAALMPVTDPYFRGFDQSASPTTGATRSVEREFDGFAAAGKAPDLMLVRLPHDHTGGFSDAIDGVNTVEDELADNDYAVGLFGGQGLQEPFRQGHTLIFIVEDDAQDGPDHVDAHRSTAYVVGPYVKQQAVVSRHYTTVNLDPDHGGGAEHLAHGPQRRSGRTDERGVRPEAGRLELRRPGSRRAAHHPAAAAAGDHRGRWLRGASAPDGRLVDPGHGRPGLQPGGPAQHPGVQPRALARPARRRPLSRRPGRARPQPRPGGAAESRQPAGMRPVGPRRIWVTRTQPQADATAARLPTRWAMSRSSRRC